MSERSNIIFRCLQVVAWIIFIGLCIEAGGLLVNFFFSLFNPELIPKLYQKLDLSQLYQQSRWSFFGMYGFILFIAFLKAFLFYVVIRLLSQLDLSRPFNSIAAEEITRLSYFTLSIGLIGYVASQIALGLQKSGMNVEALNPFWNDSVAFILMSAVIYIIAVIFTRGVDIQNENELTV